MDDGNFFESRRRHVVQVKDRRVVGTIFWNKVTGLAFVVDQKQVMVKITEEEASRIYKIETTMGRPKLFDEPVRRVMVTLPERIIKKLYPFSISVGIVQAIDKAEESK